MINQQIEKSLFAKGAIIGALAGDAAGATLEFMGRKPNVAEVEHAMSMVGGGVWGTAPGQVTDDGELTLALAHALSGKAEYDQNRAAYYYRKWFLSDPFDVGNATTSALSQGEIDSATLYVTIMKNAQQYNSASKANGSLMRSSALGVWSVSVSVSDAVNAARQDALLTHPNVTCQWSVAAYVVAIRHLLLNHGDAHGAFQAAQQVLVDDDSAEVMAWLEDAHNGNLPDFHPLAGFVRIGFTHAFYHLLQQSDYDKAIHATLLGGGDTDTNACIVGGLIGALHGVSSIPEAMRTAIINCDTSQGRTRPDWLSTRRIEELIEQIA